MIKNLEDIKKQFNEVKKYYPKLEIEILNSQVNILGDLDFTATFKGETITDNYEILIEIPSKYPEELPKVKETSRKIRGGFHINPGDYLCLEVDTKIKMMFNKNPYLLYYIETFVVNYLYSYSYFKKYKKLPFGERAHGVDGIIGFYKEVLDIDSANQVMDFLKYLKDKSYRGHHLCPCGSEEKIRNCHGKKIKELNEMNLITEFENDYRLLVQTYNFRRR